VLVFGNFPTLFMAMGRKDGNLCLYGSRRKHEGWLRFGDADGNILADHIHPRDYHEYIGEGVDEASYMKAPYYKPTGFPLGVYRVGPAARLNLARQCGTPLADEALNEFRRNYGNVTLSSFHNHYARLIETIFAIERIQTILEQPLVLDPDVRAEAKANEAEGVGIIEAPRGTLLHHYEVTEGMLNRMEGLIRCFDPCLSCATHAGGKMPLVVDVLNADCSLARRIARAY